MMGRVVLDVHHHPALLRESPQEGQEVAEYRMLLIPVVGAAEAALRMLLDETEKVRLDLERSIRGGAIVENLRRAEDVWVAVEHVTKRVRAAPLSRQHDDDVGVLDQVAT